MSAENAIVILVLTNPETFEYEYYVGHYGNLTSIKYAENVLDFIRADKVKKFYSGQMMQIMEFSRNLEDSYGGTEYGIITETRYNLFTTDELERFVNENYANNS